MLKRTKIVCTMGPACDDEGILKAMMESGMNVARFNFSHGTHEEQKVRFERVCKVRDENGFNIATLMDTKGPEIRLGVFENGKEMLEDGAQFVLTTEEMLGTVSKSTISYKNLRNDVHKGSTILINDGIIEMVVNDVTDTDIICTVVHGGVVSNRKGINVPGVELSMPYLSRADMEDILFGIETGYDFIAISFVRNAEDVMAIRGLLDGMGSHMKIIAKIENRQGVEHLDEILKCADGIMVARGDMGVEIPFEEVPHIQKEMIAKAVKAGKHVITATQMLESMTNYPRPTRAEVSDVANAIYDGTTAIMLSGETAAGKYPVESVQAMAKIAVEAEGSYNYRNLLETRRMHSARDITTAIAFAACAIAEEVSASAIIPVTMYGGTCRLVSSLKPLVPIIGCSVSQDVCHQMALLWGVEAVNIDIQDSEEALFYEAVRASKEAGLVKKGDRVVITAGLPLGRTGTTNMVRVMEVD